MSPMLADRKLLPLLETEHIFDDYYNNQIRTRQSIKNKKNTSMNRRRRHK